MSLVALALRVATVQALKGRTIAGSRVIDSPLEPLDEAASDERAPFIAVFIDREDSRPDVRNLLTSETRSFEIVLHVFLPERVEIEMDGQSLTFDTGDTGGELVQNLVGRQIVRALQASTGPWPDLWRRFVVKIERYLSRPYLVEISPNVRLSAREVQLTVLALDEPDFGVGVHEPWGDLLAALREEGSADLAALADVLEMELTEPGDLPDWRRVMAALNVNRDTVARMGLAPLDGDAGDDGALFDALEIEGGGATTASDDDAESDP